MKISRNKKNILEKKETIYLLRESQEMLSKQLVKSLRSGNMEVKRYEEIFTCESIYIF